MKRPRLIAWLVCALLLSGCGPAMSLNPLYDEKKKETIFFEKLQGEWKVILEDKDSTDDGNSRWIFQRPDQGDSYDISSFDISRKGTYRSQARIIKLDDKLFLDAEGPEISDDAAAGAPFPTIPVHSFARIWIDEHAVRIHFLDNAWLEKQKKAGKLSIAVAEVSGGLILTATTEELRKFAIEHADDESVFAVKYKLTKLQ